MVGISLLLGSSCQDTFVRSCFPSTLGVWDRWFLMTPASLMKRFRGYVCSPPIPVSPSSSFQYLLFHILQHNIWQMGLNEEALFCLRVWGYNPPWQGSHSSRECEVADHTAPIVRMLREVKVGMSLTFPFAHSRRAAHKNTVPAAPLSGRVFPLRRNLSGNSLTNTSRDVSPRWL